MRENYNSQLALLSEKMNSMAMLCQQAISLAMCVFTDGDVALCREVFEKDDEIDRLEREIETMCLRLILHQQPVAGDLRRISAALKMISDIERIGDQASDIAEIAKFVTANRTEDEEIIKQMAHSACAMVSDAVKAFADGDLQLARRVMDSDDEVDRYFDDVRSYIIEHISADNSRGEYYIDLLMIAKYLERIADHATNIAEWVEFAVTGQHPKTV
ncbi:MAG: phosphate signaling complex protein PhoU [Clostridia bacterium]|nr:phosphate signaling complex protein PhoU [Clostridia bacterium]